MVTAKRIRLDGRSYPFTLSGISSYRNPQCDILVLLISTAPSPWRSISLIRRSAFYHIHLIRRARDFLDLPSTKLLVHSLEASRLGQVLPASLIMLQAVNIATARLVLLPRDRPQTSNLLRNSTGFKLVKESPSRSA